MVDAGIAESRFAMTTHDTLEAMMLLCFSSGWYFSAFRMLRLRRAAGRGLGFAILVGTGYSLGIASKLLSWRVTGAFNPVGWLYGMNFAVIMLNMMLSLHFARREGGQVHFW
jgi:hypothetical protein